MIKSYIITAWRNILKGGVYSILNIVGLAVGMGVALIIGLWVFTEYSYDKFIPGYESLYRIERNVNNNGEINTTSSSSLALANKLRAEIPEISKIAETDYFNAHGLMVGGKKFYLYGGQTASDFLSMFPFTLLKGQRSTVLKEPFSIALTKSTAIALFGTINCLGRLVRFDNANDLTVTGILEDLPENSSLRFSYLVPFSYYEYTNAQVKANRTGSFDWTDYQIFVQLKPGINYEQVEPKIRNLEKKYAPATHTEIAMQPLAEWHLYTNFKNGHADGGFIEYVRIFSMIGILVLIIACINFINLSTARSEKRAREVGVRKAVGSLKSDLIFQFLTESVLITCIAFLFCVLFVLLAIPSFNLLTGSVLHFPFFNGFFWLVMLFCVLVTSLLAGSRPAFYLSSFNAVTVLKGKQSGKSATLSRRTLVIIQFSCSVVLIISTVVIYRQVSFAKNRPLGYSLNLLMQTNLNTDLNKHYGALKNELIQSGLVSDVTSSSSPATAVFWHTGIDWPGQYPGETVNMGAMTVTDHYFSTLGMDISQGRDFMSEAPSDSMNVLFNEAAVSRLRLKNPLGQSIILYGRKFRIIGIVKNALLQSPYAAPEPIAFFYGGGEFMMYRLSSKGNIEASISRLRDIFSKYNPTFPFTYQFMDQSYAQKFQMEQLVGKLAGIFAALAILISCLGLFGLAAYIAEQRAREISMRKVLGASIAQVWLLLSKDFIVLVLISCAIASPIAYYFLYRWLGNYSYRIAISLDVFIYSIIGAVLITLMTISFQALKAATASPVKNLRGND